MTTKSKSHGAMLAVTLAAFLVGGCSFYRAQAPTRVGVVDGNDVVWSYAWGLVPGSPKIDCNQEPLAEVTVESNFAYDLISVITLGLVSPKYVEWKCASPRPAPGVISTGTIPTPSESSSGDGDQDRERRR